MNSNEELKKWVDKNVVGPWMEKHGIDISEETEKSEETPERRAQGLKIDWDIADSITKANLLDALDCARNDVQQYMKGGGYLTSRDFEYTTEILIPALKNVLRYYGEDL